MTVLERGMIIDVDLDSSLGSETRKIRPCVIVTNDVYNERLPVVQVVPVTEWREKKDRIITNVVLNPSKSNGLTKKSIADCLQVRPIDHRRRMKRLRGILSQEKMSEIDSCLKKVFELA